MEVRGEPRDGRRGARFADHWRARLKKRVAGIVWSALIVLVIDYGLTRRVAGVVF